MLVARISASPRIIDTIAALPGWTHRVGDWRISGVNKLPHFGRRTRAFLSRTGALVVAGPGVDIVPEQHPHGVHSTRANTDQPRRVALVVVQLKVSSPVDQQLAKVGSLKPLVAAIAGEVQASPHESLPAANRGVDDLRWRDDRQLLGSCHGAPAARRPVACVMQGRTATAIQLINCLQYATSLEVPSPPPTH